MTFIDDIRDFHKFWSVRLGVLALAIEVLEVVLPMLPLPWWLSATVMAGAIVARGVAQPSLRE